MTCQIAQDDGQWKYYPKLHNRNKGYGCKCKRYQDKDGWMNEVHMIRALVVSVFNVIIHLKLDPLSSSGEFVITLFSKKA